jgi:hypothetical protein
MPVADTLPGVSVLPPTLDVLLRKLRVASVRQVLIRGWGSPCADNEHVLEDWITGAYVLPVPTRGVFFLDGMTRTIVLRVCVLCEMVQVRDRTVSVAPTSGGGTLRDSPDIHLGWYSGARAAQRTYL